MLPSKAIEFLDKAAKDNRVAMPARDCSLFTSGVLDSFSLVDFVSLLEGECGVKIDDADLRPDNFDTISKIEAFIERVRTSV
jgi:acyl carrier protein